MIKQVSLIKRGIAYIVDLYLGALLGTLPISLASLLTLGKMTQNVFILEKQIAIVSLICSLLLIGIYYILIPLKVFNGQTLGKRLVDVKIICSEKKSLIKRQILYMILFTSSTHVLSEFVSIISNYYLVSIIQEITLYLSFLFIISLIFSKQHEGIHDKLSRTYIIDLAQNKV